MSQLINLSKKFHFLAEENFFSHDQTYVNDPEFIDLTISNPEKCKLRFPEHTLREALFDFPLSKYSPHPKGLLEARLAIAKYYSKRNEKVDPENIFLTSGTSEGFSYLLKLLTEPNDEILLPTPGYPLHEYLSIMENVNTSKYYLRYLGKDQLGFSIWKIDINEIIHSITENTKAIVVVSPNNPTGCVLSNDEFYALGEISKSRNIPLIIDEVFSDFIFSENAKKIFQTDHFPIFYLNGISKLLGLPQLKLSWIRLNEIASTPEMIRGLEFISDAYLSVNTPFQNALPKLLLSQNSIQSEITERIQKNISIALDAQNKNFTFLNPQSGWNGIFQIHSNCSDESLVKNLLQNTKVLTQPGFLFDLEDHPYIVVSLLTKNAKFSEAIKRISSQKW